jgi:hypothetical protein
VSTNPSVEERLAALEKAVAELQLQLTNRNGSPDWLDKVIGSISDDEAFEQALEYGRAYRASLRPPDAPGEGS